MSWETELHICRSKSEWGMGHVAFCHFLSDLFSSISNFSLQLQKNDVILPQVKKREKRRPGDYFDFPLNMFLILRIQLSSQAVSGIESLLATIEAKLAPNLMVSCLSSLQPWRSSANREEENLGLGRSSIRYTIYTLYKIECIFHVNKMYIAF